MLGFFSKKESSCLLDLPGKSRRVDFDKIGNKAGILYDVDKQCEMILGTGSKFCKEKVRFTSPVCKYHIVSRHSPSRGGGMLFYTKANNPV